mmetsp:Transcript_38775/g.42886  ORF Transcript_38775/g.42886 Transcript_38775/m.42886 type:complete len:299 (-) Transcript_38775:257-1153(-)
MISTTTTTLSLLFLSFLGSNIEFVTGFQQYSSQSLLPKTNKKTCPLNIAPTTVREINADEDYIALTPGQIKTLRKESEKRRAGKILTTDWLPENETSGPFSVETLEKYVDLLRENEIIEIRGISKGEKRYTRTLSDELAYDLTRTSAEKGIVIERIATKGHRSIYYCPKTDGTGIVLRTTFRPYQWEPRQKPLRDISGRIIKPRAMFQLPLAEKKGPFSSPSIEKLSGLLEKYELVEVHGVSEGDKRRVNRISEQLEFDLGQSMGRDVQHVHTKRFVSTFYCPNGKGIVLRIEGSRNN